MKAGDKVKCGYVDMSRYVYGAGLEKRWFTDKVGTLGNKADGAIPPSWFIEVGGDTVLLAEDEFRVVE
jgi:hypothetical protein